MVLPVHRTRDCLPELHRRLLAALAREDSFEILYVDDACPERSAEVLVGLRHARVLSLPTNRGQIRAIEAGLRAAAGEWSAVLDSDLEDPPEELPAMLARARAGVDLVLGCPGGKAHGFWREVLARALLRLVARIAPEMAGRRGSTLTVISRRAREAWLVGPDAGLAYVHGLRALPLPRVEHEYRRQPRPHGRSSYGPLRLLRLGLRLLAAAVRRRRAAARARRRER